MMRIEAALYELTPTHRFGISREMRTVSPTVLLKVTRQDITAYGEAFPSTRYEGPASEHFQMLRDLAWDRITPYFEQYRPAVFSRFCRAFFREIDSLIAGMTTIYYDYFARRFEVPAGTLLGLEGLALPQSSFTIGLDTPEVIRQKVTEAEQYPILKVKLGTDRDEEIIRTVRDVTDKPLRVDANEGWSREEAVEKINWLAEQNVEFVEQPIPAGRFGDMRWLRSRARLPVFADEDCRHVDDLPAMMECYDGINIKLVKCGGITPALQMIRTARTFGKSVMLGCMTESSAGIAPAVVLGGLADYLDLDGNLLLSNDPFSGPRAAGGTFPMLSQPGMDVREREPIHWETVFTT